MSYRSATLDPYTFPATTGEGHSVGKLYKITGADPTPTFAHAVETFLAAHTLAGAWSTGTATKYRQTLTALADRLAGGPVGFDVAAVDTPAGATRLAEAFTAAFGSRSAVATKSVRFTQSCGLLTGVSKIALVRK